MSTPFTDEREAIARICCPNPDGMSHIRENTNRWEDFLPMADRIIAEVALMHERDMSLAHRCGFNAATIMAQAREKAVADDAFRAGAEAMREAAARKMYEWTGEPEAADSIRSVPLPEPPKDDVPVFEAHKKA